MFFLDVFLKGLKPQYDDDAVDRLNYYVTPMIFIIFALTLSAKQYVGQPIQCWIPAQFTGAWEQYSENYCFVQSTYFIRPDRYIPDSTQEREDNEIGYYQWVPFVLGIQGVLFYLPELIWRMTNWQSGIAVKSIVRMVREADSVDSSRRKEAISLIAAHIHDSLHIQSQLRHQRSRLFNSGRYLTILYLVIKFLYVVQVFFQFVSLNQFISPDYTFWGFGILSDLFHGREWQESGHFPRVTMCDFEVRVLGNKHRHTVQCVLMINMFNEKVFLFIWFWLLFVGIATICNLFMWAARLLSPAARRRFVATYLRANKIYSKDDASFVRTFGEFVERELHSDGVFVAQLVAQNVGDVITVELISNLWERFLVDEASNARSNSETAPALNGEEFHEDLKQRLA